MKPKQILWPILIVFYAITDFDLWCFYCLLLYLFTLGDYFKPLLSVPILTYMYLL